MKIKRVKRKKKIQKFFFFCVAISIGIYVLLGFWACFTIICISSLVLIGTDVVQKRLIEKKYLSSGIGEVDEMTGIQFEMFLSAHFSNLGYKVKTTSITGDYGADLVLQKGTNTIVVQAKRWKESVGIKAVQEVIGAIQNYDADEGMVVSNSTFTKNAVSLAQIAHVALWDRTKLLDIMSKANGHGIIAQLAEQQEFRTEYEKCPDCGGELQSRKGKYGEFLGCRNYPKCTYTRKIGGK